MPRLGPEWRVLESRCGIGRLSRQAAPKVRELVCSDASRSMIQEAAVHLAAFENVRMVQSRGYWLEPCADKSFDAVYAHAVFCFFDLYPAVAMLDAVGRVLRPGGMCMTGFLTMDRQAWAEDLAALARRYHERGSFGARALRRYTEAQIRAMFRAAGLEVVRSMYVTSTPGDDSVLLLEEVTPAARPGAGVASSVKRRLACAQCLTSVTSPGPAELIPCGP